MKNWLAKIIGGISLSAALFVFEACYGTLGGKSIDILVQGQVVSKKTGNSIEGIAVFANDSIAYQLTDSDGRFTFYTDLSNDYNLTLRFKDIDSTLNGKFKNVDTSFFPKYNKDIYIKVELDEVEN